MYSPAFLKIRDKIAKEYPGAFRPSTGISEKRRISTGAFALDRILGGGIPVNRLNLIYGHKATFKSTLAEKIIVEYQSVCNRCFFSPLICQCQDGPLRLMAVYNDMEKTLDEGYMARLGVDISPERFHLLRPAYGELACEYTQELAKVPEVGLIVVDSLAAIVPLDEVEEGYSKDLARGLRARLMNRMMRVLVSVVDSPTPKTVILINHLLPGQVSKAGQAPDMPPGGEEQKYLSSVVLKLWTVDKERTSMSKDGEEKVEKFGGKKEEKVGPKKQRVAFLVEYSKVSRDNISGEFSLYLENDGHIKIGDSDDWQSVFLFAQKHNLIVEEGSSFLYDGKKYPTQKSIKELWQQDRATFRSLQKQFYL